MGQTNDLIVQIALGTVKQIFSIKLGQILEDAKNHMPPEKYAALVTAGSKFAESMEEVVKLTKTRVDDTIVSFLEAVKIAAADLEEPETN